MTAELLAQFGYLVQIMGAMMVTFLAFLTHVGASPYVNRKLYRLDSAALLISLGTFSLGAFQAEDMPDWAQIVVAGLVIATNVGFLLFVAFYVRREIIFYIHECVDDLRDLFGLCCSCCRRARADSATSSDALTPKTKSLEDGDGDGSHRSKRSRRGRSKGGQGVDTPNPVMQMEMEMVSREGSSGSTGRPTRGSGSSDDSHASHGVRDTATAAHAAPPSPALAPSSKPPNVPPPTAPTMPPPAASRRDRRARNGSSGSHATEDGAGSPGRRRRGGSASSTAAAAGGGGGCGAGAGAGPSAQVIRRSELHPRPARTTMQSLEAASATKHRRRRKQRTRATAVPSEELVRVGLNTAVWWVPRVACCLPYHGRRVLAGYLCAVARPLSCVYTVCCVCVCPRAACVLTSFYCNNTRTVVAPFDDKAGAMLLFTPPQVAAAPTRRCTCVNGRWDRTSS